MMEIALYFMIIDLIIYKLGRIELEIRMATYRKSVRGNISISA